MLPQQTRQLSKADARIAGMERLFSALKLHRADSIVRKLSGSSGFERAIWQFPVVLIPLGLPECPDSIVLRPVESVDGMTAQSAPMPETLLVSIVNELLSEHGISSVFYDLTHKPPGTIEWE